MYNLKVVYLMMNLYKQVKDEKYFFFKLAYIEYYCINYFESIITVQLHNSLS